jgi:hypothetical protein
MEKDYITITGTEYYFGNIVFKVGDVISCEKEFDNDYDEEAIKVMIKAFGKVGYVANSSRTVAKGTKSAGRIYDKVGDKFYAKVRFVTGASVIVEVLKRDENNHKNNRKIHK